MKLVLLVEKEKYTCFVTRQKTELYFHMPNHRFLSLNKRVYYNDFEKHKKWAFNKLTRLGKFTPFGKKRSDCYWIIYEELEYHYNEKIKELEKQEEVKTK